MDDRRFEHACQLKQAGELREAYEEFVALASGCKDPIDKAGALLYAELCLKDAGDLKAANLQLNAVRDILGHSYPSDDGTSADNRAVWLGIAIGFEEADLCRMEGRSEEALVKFQNLLSQFAVQLHQPNYRSDYEMIQVRCGMILADLGRWSEALPILQQADSVEQPGSSTVLIDFYLGSCYVAVGDLVQGVLKLRKSLEGMLPSSLEYRAHSSLGKAYYNLGDYAQAKEELEKATQTGDPSYIRDARLWRWLEATCQHLGLKDEADRYRQLAQPPS
jgi:tetratricopeptide (TPR) repeat protein